MVVYPGWDILGLYGASPPQPEKTLMFAVLLDAVECFQEYARHEADRLFKDMEEWIFEDDPEWPGQGEQVLAIFSIDSRLLGNIINS